MALLAFSRVAFGSSVAAESFDTRELEKLTRGVFEHVRPDLAWRVVPPVLAKARRARSSTSPRSAPAPCRAAASPSSAPRSRDGDVLMSVEAVGSRARLRPEIVSGLRGEKLEGGLGGHWVQAYFLHQLLASAGGKVDHVVSEEKVVLRARVPA